MKTIVKIVGFIFFTLVFQYLAEFTFVQSIILSLIVMSVNELGDRMTQKSNLIIESQRANTESLYNELSNVRKGLR